MDISPRIITAGASKGGLNGNHFAWLWLTVLRSCLNKQMVNQQMSKELRRDQRCLSVHRSLVVLILTSFCIKTHRFCILFNDFFFLKQLSVTPNRMSVFINGSRVIQSPAGLPSLNPSSESCLQVCPPHDLNQPLQVASLKCWRTAKNTQSTHTRETEVCTWTMVTCTD